MPPEYLGMWGGHLFSVSSGEVVMFGAVLVIWFGMAVSPL